MDTTQLRDFKLIVQLNNELPRVIPDKCFELDGIEQGNSRLGADEWIGVGELGKRASRVVDGDVGLDRGPRAV